ncbi:MULTISPECIES: hypothetical protein [Pseudomonas]|uniref:Uncharacterized protein n=1 Tax=Pseudomonas segetis TaxID=298908 RepID=A0A239CQN2_9PSED|nr:MULTISPECIES: hypothetical protein [Pseudomonas]SNS22475.1 hypothetical protein SAMN05216255_1848 [Pseudomonas segetis]
MSLLRSLFAPHRPVRTFALLDSYGLCRAFRQSTQAPSGVGWVEIAELHLNWLNQPLPPYARIAPVVTYSNRKKPLAA